MRAAAVFVVLDEASGTIVGVEAVVDKDLAISLLAMLLDADALLLLTDVDAVYDGFGTPDARAVRRIDIDHLRAMRLDGPQGRSLLPVRRSDRPPCCHRRARRRRSRLTRRLRNRGRRGATPHRMATRSVTSHNSVG